MTVSTASVPLPRPRAAAPRGLRVVRIGLLGYGQVGQAVTQAAAAAAPRLRKQGLAIAIECALVRDVTRLRRGPAIARVTSNVEAFLRGRYDVVIDVLPAREPAAAIAGRVLGRGTPVVSANKAMVATDGARLRRIAARASTTLRIDACALAGVPFIGAFERRPFAADTDRFSAIVNGTSHFILTRMGGGAGFDEALREAQALGYAEPDPEADIAGRDARAKLLILAETLLGVALPDEAIATEGIGAITPEDLALAAAHGGALKPVVHAARDARGIVAFVGPAFVPHAHPLAHVSGRDNAIVIDSRASGRLVFAGPGAGPDITAATLLDDAIEAVDAPKATREARAVKRVTAVRPPERARLGRWTVLDV